MQNSSGVVVNTGEVHFLTFLYLVPKTDGDEGVKVQWAENEIRLSSKMVALGKILRLQAGIV
jgi:hypothetical protein